MPSIPKAEFATWAALADVEFVVSASPVVVWRVGSNGKTKGFHLKRIQSVSFTLPDTVFFRTSNILKDEGQGKYGGQ
jgi:hypothetical protein